MKECSKCKEEKELSEFYKDKTHNDGFSSVCKKCIDTRCLYYRLNNTEKVIKYSKHYYNVNKGRINKRTTEYSKNNKAHLHECRKLNINLNKVNFNNKQKIYVKNKRENNISFRLQGNLRARLNKALKNNAKKGSAIKDLGCSILHLKLHLELFWDEGMTWDNYGNKEGQWSIDHIKPLSKFDLTDKDQLLQAVNYRNLQPLWYIDNIKKHNKDAE